MYAIPRLTAAERRKFNQALRGVDDSPKDDPDDPGLDEPSDEESDDPKGGDTPTTPGADPGGNPMRLVSANIRHGMSVAKKREDFKKVRGLGSIIMWQEVGGVESSRSLLKANFPASDWHHTPHINSVGTRISVKKSLWTVEQSHVYQMHKKYPGAKGQRETYVALVLVTLKGTNIQFLVCNSHYTPHAWCSHNVPGKQWRKDKWTLHHSKFESIVLDARAKGITVVGGGDWNRSNPAKFHTNQVWFRQARLDHLFGLNAPGGSTFTLQSNQSVNLNSDHNALVAQLSWAAGTNPKKSGYRWSGL